MSETCARCEEKSVVPGSMLCRICVEASIHDAPDSAKEGTRVVCNPFGYVGIEENPKFDPKKTVLVAKKRKQ